MRFAPILAAGIAMLGAPPALSQGALTVDVGLSNFEFTPPLIGLQQGRSYLLRLRNGSGSGHDFTARAFFAAATIAPEDRRWIERGEVDVPPGEVREIALTAPPAGRYKVKCTHRFHKMLGMSGTILVR